MEQIVNFHGKAIYPLQRIGVGRIVPLHSMIFHSILYLVNSPDASFPQVKTVLRN